jgi:hypothetical protein
MVEDIKILICGYLQIPEVLELFENHPSIAEKILKNYNICHYPDIKNVCYEGDLRSLKFLISKNILPNESAIMKAIQKGHRTIIKYLFENSLLYGSPYLDFYNNLLLLSYPTGKIIDLK